MICNTCKKECQEGMRKYPPLDLITKTWKGLVRLLCIPCSDKENEEVYGK